MAACGRWSCTRSWACWEREGASTHSLATETWKEILIRTVTFDRFNSMQRFA